MREMRLTRRRKENIRIQLTPKTDEPIAGANHLTGGGAFDYLVAAAIKETTK